jgi:hypothetical protein
MRKVAKRPAAKAAEVDVGMTHEDILSRYPRLYGRCFDFAIPAGWLDIVAELSAKLDPLGVECVQAKQKLGELRYYISGGTDEVYAVINEAERKAAVTCEICGKPGRGRQNGWWLFVGCDEHSGNEAA